ncbi:hypothetical protein HBI54_042290 [Parastagonospora nodorum]|nr:hypothetical protein HBI54_042290 [Parastagonospora nodorum]
MFKGGWWMDSHAATLSILQNQFRESVISSLATNHLLAQYNVGHIILRGSSGVVYLHIVDAIEVYRLGYALLSHSIPRNDPHVDEGAMSKQAAMLADWVAGCYAVTDPRGYEEDFLKELWEPASVE